MRALSLLGLITPSLIIACASDGGNNDDGSGKQDHQGQSHSTLLEISRDLRKCLPSATCGGFFVKELNKELTTCIDGEEKSSCYISKIDWGPTAMPQSVAARFEEQIRKDPDLPLLLRGTAEITDEEGPVITLAVTEVWVPNGITGSREGAYMHARDNGIQCEPGGPCPDITVESINLDKSEMVTGIDYKLLRADKPMVDRGNQAIRSEDGLILTGGPSADDPNIIEATKYWTRAPVPQF